MVSDGAFFPLGCAWKSGGGKPELGWPVVFLACGRDLSCEGL